ncbi:hypothetical protein M758_1G089300 [Ceratodon purpureus]|nr:hypothetical protein M758_1G089300 [Ceratodon purpureus]
MSPSSTPPCDLSTACQTNPLGRSLGTALACKCSHRASSTWSHAHSSYSTKPSYAQLQLQLREVATTRRIWYSTLVTPGMNSPSRHIPQRRLSGHRHCLTWRVPKTC